MFLYSAFALVILCELELPELPPGEGEPDVIIRLGVVPPTSRKATLDQEFVFNTLSGAFQISDGREIVLDPLPGADPGALRVVLLGRVMACLLRQRGWLPLHASGVSVGGRGVLFVGASGAGKSTTAAAFHARGHLVITDDVGAVRSVGDQCVVQSARSRLRLFDDSRHVLEGNELRSEFQFDKYSIDLSDGTLRNWFPLKRIYVLDYGGELRRDLVAPVLAAALMGTHSFVRRRRCLPEVLEVHLSDCASVARTMPVHRLVRRLALTELPNLVRFVEDDVAATE